MASSWDDYLSGQSSSASYAAPSYTPSSYDSYDPYSYDAMGGYSGGSSSYDAGYDYQPDYSGYSYDDAGYDYDAPDYDYDEYDPYSYDASGNYTGGSQAPPQQPPVEEYVAPPSSTGADPYAMTQIGTPVTEAPPPERETLPYTIPYNPDANYDATGNYGGGYASPDLAGVPRSAPPEVAPLAPGQSLATYVAPPVGQGSDTTLTDFFAATDQGPGLVAEAEARETNLDRLTRQRQLEQARVNRGEGRIPEAQMLSAYPAPEETWLGERFSDLGTWGSEVRDTVAPVGGALGQAWESFTDPYRQTAGQVDAAVDLPPLPAGTDLSQLDPTAGVRKPIYNAASLFPEVPPDTPVLGGFAQSLQASKAAFDEADTLAERGTAAINAIADLYQRPTGWAQERQGEMAYDLAKGNGRSTYVALPGDTSRIPVVGQALQMPAQWANDASPELKAEIVRVYEEAEAAAPGSGGRAVWEYYQNPAFRNTAQRAVADTVSDPTIPFTGGMRIGGAGLSGFSRILASSSKPLLRKAAPIVATTGAFTSAAGGVTDDLLDLGLTPAASAGWNRVRNTRFGKWAGRPFELTDEARAEQEISNTLDAVGGLQQVNRAEGRPNVPPPADNLTPPNGTIPPGTFTRSNSTTRRYGDIRVITRNDTGESIVTRAENSELVTPNALTPEQAEAVVDELRAGASPADAARFGEQLRTGATTPSQPIPNPPRFSDQPDPATRVETVEQVPDPETGEVLEVRWASDYTGSIWLENPDTGGIIYGPMTTDEALAQQIHAARIVQGERTARAAQGATQTEITGRTTPAPAPVPLATRQALAETPPVTGGLVDQYGRPLDGVSPRTRQGLRQTEQPITGGVDALPDNVAPLRTRQALQESQQDITGGRAAVDPATGVSLRTREALNETEIAGGVPARDPGATVPLATRRQMTGTDPAVAGGLPEPRPATAPLRETQQEIARLRRAAETGQPVALPTPEPGTMPAPPQASSAVNRPTRIFTEDAQRLTVTDLAAEHQRGAQVVADRLRTLPAPNQQAIVDVVRSTVGRGGEAVQDLDSALAAIREGWRNRGTLAQTLEEAAAREFGLEQFLRQDVPWRNDAGVRDLFTRQAEALRPVVRAMYEVTQEQFRRDGVTSVKAGRGLINADRYVPGQPEPPLRPITSWTTDPKVAADFAESGVTLKSEIPTERILSTGLSGMGELDQKELVILGGPMPAPAAPRNRPTRAAQGRNAGRFVVGEGTPEERLVTPRDLEREAKRMETMSEAEYLGEDASAWRYAMYGQDSRGGGQYLRKTPAVEPTVEALPDGRYRVVNAKTGSPIGRRFGVADTYPTEAQARRAAEQLGGRTQEQAAAYERYLDLQAARMKNDPVTVERGLIDAGAPQDTIREIMRRAGVPESTLPPAPATDAIDAKTGQRVTVDPTANPANRLGVKQAGATETAQAGYAKGQSLRERARRPSFVTRTADQAPTQTRFRDLPLSSEEVTILERPMPKTHGADITLGDATLTYTDDVYRAKALADATSLNPNEQKELGRLADRFNTTPEKLAAMDPDALDELVFERVTADLRREIQAAGTGDANLLTRTLDAYLNYRRSVALYNKLRVPGYILANVVGNSVTTGLFKPSALFGRGMLWDPANLRHVRDLLKNPDRFGDKTVYGGVARKLGYSPRSSVVGVTKRDQLDRLWGFGENSSGFSKSLGKKLLSEEGYWAAQAVDQTMRDAIATDVIRTHLPRMISEIKRQADDAARRMGVYVSPEQINRVIDDLANAARREKQFGNLPVFSQTELKEALAGLPTNAGASPATWADRIGRDWRQATSALMDAADAEVNRLAFTFRQTNIDKALSKVVLFHYWASRASMRYVTEGLKNPWMMAAYFRATEGLNRMAEENNWPDSIKGTLKVFDSIGGWAGFFRPELILPQFLMMSETVFREEGEYGLTKLGEGLQWLSDHGIGIVPLWREFTYNLGLEGGSYRQPDSSGLAGPMDTLGAVANVLNASGLLGKIGLEYGENGPEQLPAPAAELRNLVAHWFSGLLADSVGEPFAKQVPLETEGFFQGERELRQAVADIVAREHPDKTPEEQKLLIEDIMADPYGQSADGSIQYGPIYDEAYGDWATIDAARAAMRVAAPAGAGQVAIRNVASDERRLAKQQGTPEEQQAAYAIDDAVNSAGPEDAAFERSLAEYDAARDDLGNAIADSYFAIRDGEVYKAFNVNGQTYTRQDIQAMSEDQRKRLARQWLEGMGGVIGEDAGARMDARYDAQNAILAENPALAAGVEFQARAREYGPGTTQFILDTMAINAPYREYVNAIPEPVGSPEWEQQALGKYSAWQAVQGQPRDIFTPIQDDTGAGRVAGLPEEITLANANSLRRAEREEEKAAREAEFAEGGEDNEYIAGAREDLMKLGSIKQRIDAYDPSGGQWSLYLDRVMGNEDAFLDDALYDQLKDEFDSIWPTGGAEEYLVWANEQPAGVDVSFDAWREADYEAYQARQARIEAESRSLDPATLVGRTSRPLLPDETEATAAPPRQFTSWDDYLGQPATGGAAPRSVPADPGSAPRTVSLPTQAFHERGGAQPAGIVYHITGDDDVNSTIQHFMNPANEASSHYVIDLDGTIYEMVPPEFAAWTQGDVKNPRTDIPWLNDAIRRGQNVNDVSFGIEFVNNNGGDITPEQYAAGVAITRQLSAAYGIPLDAEHVLGHRDINSVDRDFDPGPYFPMNEMIQGAAGGYAGSP